MLRLFDSSPLLFGAAGAAAVAWVSCFLGGAISIVGGCLEEGFGYWIGRDPEYAFRRS